jgi:hypothetical protein
MLAIALSNPVARAIDRSVQRSLVMSVHNSAPVDLERRITHITAW